MSDLSQDLPLGSEFPAATHEQWRGLVDGVLKGADFEKKLVATTYDGLRIQPLYARRADVHALTGRLPGAPWQVMARVDHPNAAEANRQALEDLENGANGLILVCPGSVGAQGFGIDVQALPRLLDGVLLDAGIAIECQLTREAKDLPAQIGALIRSRGLDPAACTLRAGFDPVGLMAAGASAPAAWSEIAPLFARMVAALAEEGLRGPYAAADARLIHNAGGSEAQELGYALAVAVAYWRALEAGGVPLDAARGMIFFRLCAHADQFMTMAKFRGLRKLWARVEQASGLEPQPIFVAAETSWRMMTRRDPYVNMLRVTIAAFAAGLGGADAVTVLPYTAALGLPDAFARRVARNTQLILLEESNLAKVADPAAGAGAVEDMTDQLCRAAWALFQQIEKAGGVMPALVRGLIQDKIAATRAARERAIATRKDALTGTSEFPYLAEAAMPVLAPFSPPPAREARGGEGSGVGEQSQFAALPCVRLAEPYEALRDASDRMLEKTGARPKVFLAALGAPADFIARATFAKNFFEAGGIEAVDFAGGDLPEAFAKSGAALVCLCSSDAVYDREAGEAARALAAAGARHIYLAGRPGDLKEALTKAGVGGFIYAGCDALATLQAAHAKVAAS